jgi:hypothetical protein
VIARLAVETGISPLDLLDTPAEIVEEMIAWMHERARILEGRGR